MKLGYEWTRINPRTTLRREVRLEWLSEMTGREILTTGAIEGIEGATPANTLSSYELKALILLVESLPNEAIEWLKELDEVMKTATVTEVTFEQPYKEGSINPQRLADAIESELDPKKVILASGKLVIHLAVEDGSKKAQDRIEKVINDCMREELRQTRASTLAKKEAKHE